MPKEINRVVEPVTGHVTIEYDDGTVGVIATPKKARKNIVVDAEKQLTSKGHSFTKKELKDGGYND